jgi:hypothetical protein
MSDSGISGHLYPGKLPTKSGHRTGNPSCGPDGLDAVAAHWANGKVVSDCNQIPASSFFATDPGRTRQFLQMTPCMRRSSYRRRNFCADG